MTTYAYPTIVPTSIEQELIANTATLRSALTGSIQTVSRPGERWMFTLNYENLFGDDRQDLIAFLMRLNGQEHRATIPVVAVLAHTQRGVGGGSAVVDGGSQAGATLNIRSAPLSTTEFLKAGDWLELATGQLVMVTADVDTDGSGDAAVNIIPKIRTSPSDGSALDYTTPQGTFLLASKTTGWITRPAIFSDLTVRFLEDI